MKHEAIGKNRLGPHAPAVNGQIITIYADRLALTKLKDESEIDDEVERVSSLVEFVEKNRDQTKPDY